MRVEVYEHRKELCERSLTAAQVTIPRYSLLHNPGNINCPGEWIKGAKASTQISHLGISGVKLHSYYVP